MPRMFSKLFPSLRYAFVCTFSLLATAALAQTTINVGPGQTYTTIQSGIDAANPGDTVLVAPGTYNENINFKGKAITVTSSAGAAKTIIDGGAAPGLAVVAFQSNENRTSVLSNFTIRNGGAVSFTSPAGGGIYISEASPAILNNIITANGCNGINVDAGAALIQGNIISATTFAANGYCWEGVALVLQGNQSNTTLPNSVIGNTIENNTSHGDSVAAILIRDSNGNVIVGNTIRNNVSSQGAVQMYNSESIIFSQNLVYDNSVSGEVVGYDGAGGLYLAIPDGAPPFYGVMVNNTFANNTTPGAFNEPASQVLIDGDVSEFSFVNNVLYGTGPSPLLICNGIYTYLSPGPMLVENNDVFNPSGAAYDSSCANGAGVAGNIAVDPLFKNPANNDFHLQSGSPAIDVGNNQAIAMLAPYGIDLATDLDGNPRVQDATGKGCIIDMGAYEYPGTLSQCGTTETLISSQNPATAGQSVTFTAQLTAASGTPTGAIQFLDGANLLSTQPVSSTGSASFTTSSLAVGSHTITANYQPTGTFSSSTASLIQNINAETTSTALTCLPNPIDISYPAQFTATVTSASGTPTGSIAFTDNGSLVATQALLNGATSFTDTPSTVGTHTIVATYAPTGSFAPSSATCSEAVNPFPTISVLAVAPTTSTYGSPVTLTATVAPARVPAPGTPTGVVTFSNGTSTIGAGTLAGGVATLSAGSLPGGSYNLTCTYAGDSTFSTSNCNSVPVTVNPAPTALTISSASNPAPVLSTINFTVFLMVNGQSAGAGNTIQLSIDGRTISFITDATGGATCAIFANIPPNSYPVVVSFAGTNNLLASSASLTQVVTAVPTSISVTASPNPGDLNQPVTITATVSSSAPTGNVTFYDGSTSLGSSPLTATGTARMTTSFSTLGIHNLTAVYAGDTNFTGSTSPVFAETIQAGDFSIGVLPAAATFYTGQAAAVQVSVASLQGFIQPLALTCTGLPANATCTFTPDSLPQGQGAAKLVIQTAPPHDTKAASVSGSAAVLAGLSLLLLPGRRRRRFLAGLPIVLLAIGVAVGISGCGSPTPITSGTPPGVYQVAVTATAAGTGPTLSHSAVVTLTVKSLF